MMPRLIVIVVACCLCGCSTLTVEPNRTGAANECATVSANLPMYNDCRKQVDTFFDDYEQHRKQMESDEG